jgi:uncharacterized Ntn-hydrolase superfamily protein
MARAYGAADGDLAERLLVSLEAGQAAGGDIRGRQSASLLIVGTSSTSQPWADKVMDLRVEDHPEPIRELRRLVHLHRAYGHVSHGDDLLGVGRVEEAMHEYGVASAMVPDSIELPFWHAVALANLGRVGEALPIFRRVFSSGPHWAALVKRLPHAGLLDVAPETLALIMAQLPSESGER